MRDGTRADQVGTATIAAQGGPSASPRIEAGYQYDLVAARYRYISPLVEQLTGFRPDELARRIVASPGDCMPPQDAAVVAAIKDQSLQVPCGVQHRTAFRFWHRDGGCRWLEDRFVLVADSAGQPAVRVGTLRMVPDDVSAAGPFDLGWQVEEALTLAGIGLFHWHLPSDAMTWSAGMYGLTGRDRALPPPRSADLQALLAPASWELASRHLDHARATGVPFRFEAELIQATGRRIWTEINVCTVLDADAQVDALHGTVQDIDARRRAQNALQADLRQLVAVFEAAAESIVMLATDGCVLALNEQAAQRLGRRKEDAVGRTLADLLPREVAALRGRYLQQAVVSGQQVAFEDLHGGRWLAHTLCPVLDEHGQVVRVVDYSRDETRRKQADDERRIALASAGGILPICCGCKRIRDSHGHWEQIDVYLTQHAGTKFSHGLCPECLTVMYPDERFEDLDSPS